MTYIMKDNKRFGINSNKAEDIVYDENKSIKDKIDELDSNISEVGSGNAYDIKCLDKDGEESDLQTQLNSLYVQIETFGTMLALTTDNGKKSFHTNSANNNYGLSITFNKEFVSPPEVKCSAVTNYDDGTYSAALGATVSNITNVGCTIVVNVWCAYPTTTTVTWSATGYEKTT